VVLDRRRTPRPSTRRARSSTTEAIGVSSRRCRWAARHPGEDQASQARTMEAPQASSSRSSKLPSGHCHHAVVAIARLGFPVRRLARLGGASGHCGLHRHFEPQAPGVLSTGLHSESTLGRAEGPSGAGSSRLIRHCVHDGSFAGRRGISIRGGAVREPRLTNTSGTRTRGRCLEE
jgi:hypothetical protein